MNPCPCGYYGDAERECTCNPTMISRYQKRISGPMMDRIDIHAEVPRVDYDKLTSNRLGEPSEAVRERVEAAREVQRARFDSSGSEHDVPGGRRLTCNAAWDRPRCASTARWIQRARRYSERQCSSCT
jgi:predicted ATPase with chaperone activity